MKIISVIVPSYNVEQYLDCTIESLVKCKHIKDIQIIIVNDGSKDSTLQIAKKHSQQYPDSILVIDKENGGHGSTINAGLDQAIGKYLCVIDGDDWVDSEAFDTLIDKLRFSECDVAISGHYRNYMNDGIEKHLSYDENADVVYGLDYLLEKGYQIPMTDTCYRTSLLNDINLRIQENTFYVDEEFCTIPYQKVERVIFTGLSYYHYRLGNVNQSVSPMNMVNRIEHRLRVFNRLFEIYTKENLNDSVKEYFTRRLVAVVNTTFLIYYVYYPNRKQGRYLANLFLEKIQTKDNILIDRSKMVRKKLLIFNRLYIPSSIYDYVKKL